MWLSRLWTAENKPKQQLQMVKLTLYQLMLGQSINCFSLSDKQLDDPVTLHESLFTKCLSPAMLDTLQRKFH